jgi:NitT/TauT family transport system substrate-binding protein
MSRAIVRTQSWVVDHSAAELAAVVAPYFADVARDDLVSAFRKYKDAGLWSHDTTVTREGFQRLAVSLRSGGFISRVPDFDDCVADILLN